MVNEEIFWSEIKIGRNEKFFLFSLVEKRKTGKEEEERDDGYVFRNDNDSDSIVKSLTVSIILNGNYIVR